MTATNHMLTGAVIAVTVRQPALAVPLAFLSHFILDALPHFGIHEDEVLKRNKHPLFRSVVGADILLVVVILIVLPLLVTSVVWWALLLAMLAAYAPDSIWLVRFWREVRTQTWRPGSWYARWHQKIQWSEKPWGLGIEIVWAVMMLTAALTI